VSTFHRGVKYEVKRQIEQDNTHYCDPREIPSRWAAVATHFRETCGIPATPDRVVVFPGAKPPIAFSQQI
jgi:aspartate aminotransferase